MLTRTNQPKPTPNQPQTTTNISANSARTYLPSTGSDTYAISSVNTTVLNRVRRAWAIEQGWNELAAFYVDRALDWYLKPPTAGRFITNKEV